MRSPIVAPVVLGTDVGSDDEADGIISAVTIPAAVIVHNGQMVDFGETPNSCRWVLPALALAALQGWLAFALATSILSGAENEDRRFGNSNNASGPSPVPTDTSSGGNAENENEHQPPLGWIFLQLYVLLLMFFRSAIYLGLWQRPLRYRMDGAKGMLYYKY